MIDVDLTPKVIVMPAPAPEASTDLPGGASLAKQTIDLQLRFVHQRCKTSGGLVDGETVKSLKDMTSVYETLSKIEREERRADKLADRLAAMTDAQLDELERKIEQEKRT